MSETDVRIGRNLARLRGDMSQAEFAKQMRDRGWKWAQNTVSAIESGERPLRLAEAHDVGQVLNIGLFSIDTLIAPDMYTELRIAMARTFRAAQGLEQAVHDFERAQADLAIIADLARDAGVETGHTQLVTREWLTRSVDKLAREYAVGEDGYSEEGWAESRAHNEANPGSSYWLNLLNSVQEVMFKLDAAERKSEGSGDDLDPEAS